MSLESMNSRSVSSQRAGGLQDAGATGSSGSSGGLEDNLPDLNLLLRILAIQLELMLQQQDQGGGQDAAGMPGGGDGGGCGRRAGGNQLSSDMQRLLAMLEQELEQALSGAGGGDGGGGQGQGPSPLDTASPAPSAGAAPAPSPAGGSPSGSSPQPSAPAQPAQAQPAPAGNTPGKADAAGPVTPASTTQPPNSVNVRDFGAKGDGSADDQVALEKAVSAAKQSGQSVYMPPGTYAHSGTLTLDGVKMSGAGDKSVLKATNPDHAAIRLTGDGASLENVKTEVPNAGSRSSQPEAANVLLQDSKNATVSNVDAVGAASNGIRLDNAHGSNVRNNLVQASNADGIAMMNGSSDNNIQGNVVHQSGDDAISDDSYVGDKAQDQRNTIQGNTILDSKYGRGIAVMGGADAKVTGNTIIGVPGKGIDVGTDANSGTMAGSAQVDGNVVKSEFDANSGNGTAATPQAVKDAMPDIAALLGRDATLVDRWQVSPDYRPGTGNGANNLGGVRS